DPAAVSNRLRRVLRGEIAIGGQRQRRLRAATVRQYVVAQQRGTRVERPRTGQLADGLVEYQRPALVIAREQPVVSRTRRADDEPRRVRVAREELEIDRPL